MKAYEPDPAKKQDNNMTFFRQKWFRKKSLISEFSEQLSSSIHGQKSAYALRAAKIQAELALKAKSEFIANMSHELRTPLNAIMGFSDMLALLKANDPQKVLEYANYIKEAAEHLLHIINEILDLSKIQAEKLTIAREAVDLYTTVTLCVGLITPRAENKEITINIETDSLEKIVYVDPLRVKQIILNILSNAVKFTPKKGEIMVILSHPQEHTVRLTIRDTGIGMTPEELSIACTPFGQVESAFHGTHDGTGLGLPIALELARMHAAPLKILSKKGEGTTVFIDFSKKCDKKDFQEPTF